ncbi:hypothetical protein HKX48_004905 [Thoreauomyces humboldtii]|nr:hypothetical protein HKX48_004905 [Thoreauomyces humboldtii]
MNMKLPPLPTPPSAPSGNVVDQIPATQAPAPPPPRVPRHNDPISHAVREYLLTGCLPSTDFDIPIPGPDSGPGRGMTGCITSAFIAQWAQEWYLGCDGEIYQKGTGPGPVRYDGPVLGRKPVEDRTVKDKMLAAIGIEPAPRSAFDDWND